MDADRLNGPAPGDAAVATVVGAVLVAAIAVAGLILYRTSFVPVQEEQAEHRFSVAVAERLLELRTDLDEHLGRTGSGTLTTPVPVGQGPGGPLAPPRSPNMVAFDPGGGATVHAPSARVTTSNGTSLAQTDPIWTPFTGTGTAVENITEVRELWVKLPRLDNGMDDDAARVRVNDPDGFAGQLRASVNRTDPQGPQADYELLVEVQNASGETIFEQPVTTFDRPVTDYRLHATSPDLPFQQVLAAAGRPLRLVFTENPLDAEYSMTWTQTNRTSGVETIHPGGGPVVRPFRSSEASGALRYEARNNHFVDQTFRIEHGAVLLSQGGGAVLRVPPATAIGRVDDRAVVDLPLPTLQGPGTSTSGRSTIAVSTTPVERDTARVVASSVSVNVTTPAPDAWTRFWNASLDAALPDRAWTTRNGSDWVNATVSGLDADPDAFDVDLHLRQATIRTIMER